MGSRKLSTENTGWENTPDDVCFHFIFINEMSSVLWIVLFQFTGVMNATATGDNDKTIGQDKK